MFDAEYGLYIWWPPNCRPKEWQVDPFEGKIHPDDAEAAVAMGSLGPCGLVLEKVGREGGFFVIRYGNVRLRVDPSLWQPVVGDGFRVGDRVEVLARGGRNTPRIGTIRAMLWHYEKERINYYLQEGDRKISKRYEAEDLRLIEGSRE